LLLSLLEILFLLALTLVGMDLGCAVPDLERDLVLDLVFIPTGESDMYVLSGGGRLSPRGRRGGAPGPCAGGASHLGAGGRETGLRGRLPGADQGAHKYGHVTHLGLWWVHVPGAGLSLGWLADVRPILLSFETNPFIA